MDPLKAKIRKQFDSGKKSLEWLSKDGEFVFHGSPQKLERLEPHQQTHYNKKNKKSEPDGKPAVCAAVSYEVAIFRALISSPVARLLGIKNYYSEFGLRKGKPYFKANQESVEMASRLDALGYVHVFSKKDFQPHDNLESRAYKGVEPLFVIEVKSSDLPKNIEIIKEPQ